MSWQLSQKLDVPSVELRPLAAWDRAIRASRPRRAGGT